MDLTPAQTLAEWKAGRFLPAYYFFGEDASAKAELVEQLKQKLAPSPFNLNEYSDPNPDARDIVSAALTPPVFGERRLVLVKSPKLGVEARRTLAEYLGDPLETTTLVLVSEDRKPDIRDVLAAAVAARQGIVILRPMKEEEAQRRILGAAREAGSEMEEEAAELLVTEVGTDWTVLRDELRKLLLYTQGKPRVRREDAVETLGYRKNSNPFDFPRVLETRDQGKALALMERLWDDGMEPLQLLYKISWTLNRQLRAKRMKAAGKNQGEIFAALRLQSYYDRDFLRWVDAVGEASLIRALRACVELESRLKSETWLDGRIELERLVGAICARKTQALAGAA